MYQLIVATTDNDKPTLSIEDYPTGRATYEAAFGRLDLSIAATHDLIGFVTAASKPGDRKTLHNDRLYPVAVVVRL